MMDTIVANWIFVPQKSYILMQRDFWNTPLIVLPEMFYLEMMANLSNEQICFMHR